VLDCQFENTMDVGFTYNERAVCCRNISVKSADNGFSLSRGNKQVICTDNTVELAAYAGVWCAGFEAAGNGVVDAGPTHFVVATNTIKNVGQWGVFAGDGPRYGVITSNTIEGVRRGPTDEPTDSCGQGVFITGYPLSELTTPTVYAESILVANNTIRNASRSGVEFRGSKALSIISNLIVDCGSQYLADG
jgi:hypothetical protein